MQMENGTHVVSDFIAGITWEQLPLAVQRKSRMALLDILGATLAGTLTSVSKITADYAAKMWPGNEAIIPQRCWDEQSLEKKVPLAGRARAG